MKTQAQRQSTRSVRRLPRAKSSEPNWFFCFSVAIACASLFIGVKREIGGAEVRPFDGVVALVALSSILFHGSRFFNAARVSFRVVWPLLAAYVIRSLNAVITYGPKVALIETIQASEFFVLTALVGAACQSDRSRRKFLIVVTSLLAIIGIFTLAYVAAQGEGIRNLKELTSPRYVYGLVSLSVIGGILAGFYRTTTKSIVIAALWLPILFLSAERSAWAAMALVVVSHFVLVLFTSPPNKFLRRILVSALVVVLVVGSVWTVAAYNETIARQVDRLIEPFGLISLSRGEIYFNEAESPSNQSRLFQLDNVLQIFKSNPIFGVGTNRYYYYAFQNATSEGLLVLEDIHGEFWLLLSENGIVAVLFVCIFWIRLISHFYRLGLLSRQQQARPVTKLTAFSLVYSMVAAFTIGAGSVNLFMLYLPGALLCGILIEEGKTKARRVRHREHLKV